MNLGDNLLLHDISMFDRVEAEEALMVMRYFFVKEISFEKKANFLEYIDKLEARLITLYATEMDARLANRSETSELLENV